MEKTNFHKWLELNTDLQEKSLKSYVGVISKIDTYFKNHNSDYLLLEEINSPEKLEELKQEYFSDSSNKDLDKRGNRMYSAGFNNFINYKSSQGAKKVGDEGIIYIISNPAMPGLVKIGKTINLEQRMNSLFNSSIPLPFRCIYAKKVKNYNQVELKLHRGLNSHRENPNREFFRISEEEVINFLELVEGEDVTPREDHFADKEDEIAFERATRVGQRFNFDMVGIPVGSTLQFLSDENVTCKVKSHTRVEFEGEDHSLSSAGLIAKNRMGYNWRTIAGPLNWKFEGEVLDDRRVRLESSE
tara:strand:+ start:47 stop:949 length:903 start_codon:yes stop_codon:yes gene_type:complete